MLNSIITTIGVWAMKALLHFLKGEFNDWLQTKESDEEINRRVEDAFKQPNAQDAAQDAANDLDDLFR